MARRRLPCFFRATKTSAARDYFYLDVLAGRGRGVGGGRASAMGRRGKAGRGGAPLWCERLLLCTNDAYHRLAVVYITSLGVSSRTFTSDDC